MPSSKTLAGKGCLLAGLSALLLALPALAFDPERDTWLLPPPDDTAAPRTDRVVDPLEYARMKATGNDQEPEYADTAQRALLAAVETDDRPVMETLLQQGVNPNGRPNALGATALVRAADLGRVEMTRLLLEAGADPDLKAGGYTPLGMAALRGHARIATLLLRQGANPDLKSSDGNTPLTAAAAFNRVDVLRALMSFRPDPTLFNREGRTALSVAALEGYLEAVQAMLAGGMDPNVLDKRGGTALNAASIDDHDDIVALLVEFGATIR